MVSCDHSLLRIDYMVCNMLTVFMMIVSFSVYRKSNNIEELYMQEQCTNSTYNVMHGTCIGDVKCHHHDSSVLAVF